MLSATYKQRRYVVKILNTIIYCILLSVANIRQCVQGEYKEYSPGGEPFQIIGIFSNCSDRNPRSKEFRRATICKKSIEWVAGNKEYVGNATKKYHREIWKKGYFDERYLREWTLDDIEYISFDVCTHEDATRLALDIMLGQQYYVTDKLQGLPRWRSNGLDHGWQWTQKILAVLLHTNNNTTDILLHVLHTGLFPLYLLDANWLSNIQYLLHHPRKLFPARDEYQDYLEKVDKIIKRKNIAKMTFVLVSQRDPWYDHAVKVYAKKEKYCVFSARVDVARNSSMALLLRHLKRNDLLKYIFLFGRPADQISFMNHATEIQVNDKTWILKDIELAYKDLSRIPESTTLLTPFNLQNKDLYFIESVGAAQAIQKYVSESLDNKTTELEDVETLKVCTRQMKRMIVGFMKSFDRLEFQADDLTQYITRFTLHGYTVSRFKSLNQIKFNSKTGMFDIYRTSHYLLTADNILCNKTVCGAGHHNVYRHYRESKADGYLGNTSWRYWNWRCDLCSQNWYKDSMTNNDECLPCPVRMLSTTDRSHCYDPYRKTYNNVEHESVRICLALSVIGCVSTLVVLSVFFLHRETSLVRSCDFRIVALHLVLLMTAFISYPSLFCQFPFEWVCLLRPFLVCFLNCTCTSILFMKSNRVLMIIQSRLRVRQKDVNRLMFWHVATWLLFNVIGAFIAYVCILQVTSNVSARLDMVKLTMDLFCTDGAQVNVQIYYHLALQILPAVQAFRGRNLPGPFNEAMIIVYTTFITIVTYVAMQPIYHFQDVESNKATVQCCTLVLINLVQLALFYWKKVFVVVFQRHKNTKEYVRTRVQEKILVDMNDCGYR